MKGTWSFENSNNKIEIESLFGLVDESATLTVLIVSVVFPYFKLNFSCVLKHSSVLNIFKARDIV